MDLLELLKRPEGKTLDFKRDLSAPEGALRTIVAFANTAGGTLVVGVEDGTRHVRGVPDPLELEDLRPLIIDQPEENLDPSSVYADLVAFFRDAAKRRQIIMVTHNANLVVNTDSDQVIMADAQRTSPTSLPMIRYVAGGLEDAETRSHVCRLLEGGEEAFRKRGLRYGLPH